MTSDAPDSTPPKSSPKDVQAWLRQEPSLSDLARAFPDEWRAVQREITELESSPDPDAAKRYITSLTAPPAPRPGAAVSRKQREQAALSVQIRRHMAATALRQARVAAATGVTRGRVRFNLLNGWVAQKLLFERDLIRKPVPYRRFRAIWPLLWQRRFLMPLVEPKGIYCFYSDRLIRELAAMIGNRSCVEIGAGDGTLARFLTDAGTKVTATDDFSWGQSISYPKDVRRLDARQALRQFGPEVVICSFPPPANTFEADVFKTRSVQLYVVIGSKDESAAGSWAAYRSQTAFDFQEESRLSKLVLPPELHPAVYVFRRR
jgi:hypothetical protein